MYFLKHTFFFLNYAHSILPISSSIQFLFPPSTEKTYWTVVITNKIQSFIQHKSSQIYLLKLVMSIIFGSKSLHKACLQMRNLVSPHSEIIHPFRITIFAFLLSKRPLPLHPMRLIKCDFKKWQSLSVTFNVYKIFLPLINLRFMQ